MLEEENTSFGKLTQYFSLKNDHLKRIFGDQCSPTHMQGALVLLVHLAGSVIALYFQYLREHQLVERILGRNPPYL
jgi:hypothetical protein